MSTLHDPATAAMTESALHRELSRANEECEALRRALAVERSRIGTLFEKAPAFVAWGRGPDHVFEGANEAYRRIVGFRDIIGKPVAEAIPEAVEQGLVAALDRVLETGEPFVADGMRVMLQRGPGAEPEEIVANFVFHALVEADGSRSGVFCHGIDVTEQLRVTSALRESEALLRASEEIAGVGSWSWDVRSDELKWSDELFRIFGHEPGSFTPGYAAFLDQIHPDDRARVKAIVTRSLGEGESFEFAHRLVCPDGELRSVECRGRVLRDAAGAPLRMLGSSQDVTARLRAEEQLRESEARIRALAETAHEGIWSVDQVGVTTYVNARLCELLGYDAGDIVGKPFFDFMPRETAFEARTLFARRQRGIAEVHEFAFARRDGSELYALMSMSPLFAADGEFAGALAMVTDITARRRAEEALRASEARYRHVVANAPGMVYQFVFRPDGSRGYTFVSEGARELLGVEPEEALRDPETLLRLVHPDEIDELRRRAREVAEAGGEFRWEGRVVLASGEERYVEVAAHDQRAPDGTLISDGLVLDVTDRRRAAQRLDESEARFRLVARATNDVVYDWNIATGELFWGETLLTAFGHDAALVGPGNDWWLSMVHPDDSERVSRSLEALLAGDSEAWTEEYRFRRADGTYARVLDRSFVLRDAAGVPVRLVGSMIDLTEHQFLEEQLRQSQKMEAVGRLAGGVAHDFNNLITIIKASTSFLLADMDAVDARSEDVRQIAAAADRAAGLTRQLLAFSRKQILNPTPVQVNGVVENFRPMLARLIGEHIAVETKFADDTGSIMADVGQLEQVLINLAVNARDAMPDGGRIVIETAQVTLDGRYAAGHSAAERTVVIPGEYVMLAVSDTGAGMTRDVQARIFEPFYTTKEAGKGTGLGLSTVYGIVKQSGGHVWVYSEPGHGTVFKLYFPRISAAVASPPGQAVARKSAGGSETILLVEDEDALRQLARRILARQGYQVLESRNGREALERATQHDGPIHLVLTDVIMPEMSGRGLVERLRAVRPQAAVLYMSGYTDDDVVRRGLFEPGSRFVQKPFLPDELLRVVRRALNAGCDVAAYPR